MTEALAAARCDVHAEWADDAYFAAALPPIPRPSDGACTGAMRRIGDDGHGVARRAHGRGTRRARSRRLYLPSPAPVMVHSCVHWCHTTERRRWPWRGEMRTQTGHAAHMFAATLPPVPRPSHGAHMHGTRTQTGHAAHMFAATLPPVPRPSHGAHMHGTPHSNGMQIGERVGWEYAARALLRREIVR